jgi:hypothetical protein
MRRVFRIMSMEKQTVKKALEEIALEEPEFIVRLFASLPQDQLARLVAALPPRALKEAVIDAIRDDKEFMARLAALVASRIAVPLDVATRRDLKRLERRMAKLEREVGDVKSRVEGLEKEVREIKNVMATKDDLKQFATKEDVEQLRAEIRRIEGIMATKEDIKRIEDKMATKEQFEAIAVSVEDSGRDMVQYLLGQRGHRCVAERLRVDSDYEFDIYCNAGALTAVGEVKVRAGGRDVEKTLERARESSRGGGRRRSPAGLCRCSTPSSQSLLQCKGRKSLRCGLSRAEGSWCRWMRFHSPLPMRVSLTSSTLYRLA